MPNTLIRARDSSHELWTPWGPQKTMARDPKLSAIRATLKKLGKSRKPKTGAPAASEFGKPECSYEP